MEFYILLNYFIVYSFLGWILESLYKTILDRKLVNSGFLAGPFCPIYGYGALIMYLFLNRFENSYILLFVSSFIILSGWEYIVGWFLEIAFNTKYWDYSNNKFNINGRVCLLNSFYWGVLGIIFIKFIHPQVERLISIIPENLLITITVILAIYMVIDTIITSIRVIRVNIKLSILDDINKKIQGLLPNFDGLKNINIKINKTAVLRGVANLKKKNESALIELKRRRDELVKKVTIQTKRLRRAFPSMKSERIFKYIDLTNENEKKSATRALEAPKANNTDDNKRS